MDDVQKGGNEAMEEKRKIHGLIPLLIFFFIPLYALVIDSPTNLEPFTYKEDFETNELNAWASYPLWQDTAFDPNLRPGRILPSDPNISLLLRVTPYFHVDQYAGAQKQLDLWLTSTSTIRLRYYLKTEERAEYVKIRLAAGKRGVVDYTVPLPPTNRWTWLDASWADLVAQNPELKDPVLKVNGLAVLAKFPAADPAMPIYLGLDDITIAAAKTPDFCFLEPEMEKLTEWKPYIPKRHYSRGDSLQIRGQWSVKAEGVALRIMDFSHRDKVLFSSRLRRAGGEWVHPPIRLAWPEGLYFAELVASAFGKKIASTEFTFIIAPQRLSGSHPRLWFDQETLPRLRARLSEERFRSVAEGLARNAKEAREKLPLENVVFDIDVFPQDEPTLGNVPRSIYPWFDRIRPWRAGIHQNSLAYALLGDEEAGRYAKNLIVKICQFPFWVHPWFESRGQHIYYPVGELGMDVALAYDLLFGLMTEVERQTVRAGLRRNVVQGCHRSYVEDNLVTSNTSNWVAHITGGSLMSQAAVYGDGAEAEAVEPYLTGALFKLHELIQKSIGRDGGYGESYGYCNFTMESLAKVLPALIHVFKIDFSDSLYLTYQDIAWATLYDKKFFPYFGDSGGTIGPMTNWAWLLARKRDPLLGWLYHFFKKGETLADVIYLTGQAPQREPFNENPVRVFRDIGTSVFRSGWKADDFVFVLRTGAFFNHQHLDQGTFWLADRGQIFIEERHGSTYYDDPIYQSHYIQPIAHSTILIDHNAQSQRVGDPLRFIEGFEDHAFIHHFLEGKEIAFVSGDMGKLYWGKAKDIKRNVVYFKPRTILLLDTVEPAEKDVAVTLLFQAGAFKDIHPDDRISFIRKGDSALSLVHLWPEKKEIKAEETPLYINTLKTSNPLIREGLLSLTTWTSTKTLLVANLLTTETAVVDTLEKTMEKEDGYIQGKIQNWSFIISTQPGETFQARGWTSDALSLAWSGDKIFVALGTTIFRDGKRILHSSEPMTCELSPGQIKYDLARPATISIRQEIKPRSVSCGGQRIQKFTWDGKNQEMGIDLPAGENVLKLEYQ